MKLVASKALSVEAVDAVGGLVDAVEAPGVGYCSTYLLFLPVG